MKRTTKKTLAQLPETSEPMRSSKQAGEHADRSAWEDQPGTAALGEELDESASSQEEQAPTDNGPDDALGLYLRQMGAIPLLSRKEEITLAERLERARTRYRRAALHNWRTLDLVLQTFQKIRAGQLALDPNIDVVTTLGLTREKILERIPHNLPTL